MLAAVAVLLVGNLTRTEFHRRLQNLPPEITVRDVRRILGPPDRILTEEDPRVPVEESSVIQLWGYGGGRSGFPTSGIVSVLGDNSTCYVDSESNPLSIRTSESEIGTILDQTFGNWVGGQDPTPKDDPLAAIRIANRLLPLGKEKVLDAFQEYERLTSNDRATFRLRSQILSLLFINDSLSTTQPYKNLNGAVEDIPLSTTVPWWCVQYSGDYALPIQELRRHGVLRKTPIVPPNDPVGWLERLSNQLEGETKAQQEKRLQDELIQLLRTVLNVRNSYLYPEEPPAVLRQLRGKVICWDRGKACYTFGDGTVIPGTDVAKPIRKRWVPDDFKSFGGRVLVTCRQRGEQWVTVRCNHLPARKTTVRLSDGSGKQVCALVLGEENAEGADDPRYDHSIAANLPNGFWWISTRLFFDKGQTLRVTVQNEKGRCESKSFLIPPG